MVVYLLIALLSVIEMNYPLEGHSCYNKKTVFLWLWWHWLDEAVTQKKGDGASNDDDDNEYVDHDKDADDNSLLSSYAHNNVCPVNISLSLN